MTKKDLKMAPFIKKIGSDYVFFYILYMEKNKIYGHKMFQLPKGYYAQSKLKELPLKLSDYNSYKPQGHFIPKMENFP